MQRKEDPMNETHRIGWRHGLGPVGLAAALALAACAAEPPAPRYPAPGAIGSTDRTTSQQSTTTTTTTYPSGATLTTRDTTTTPSDLPMPPAPGGPMPGHWQWDGGHWIWIAG